MYYVTYNSTMIVQIISYLLLKIGNEYFDMDNT